MNRSMDGKMVGTKENIMEGRKKGRKERTDERREEKELNEPIQSLRQGPLYRELVAVAWPLHYLR